jgi:hypothetical protein
LGPVLVVLGICWLTLTSVGCQPDEEIRHYQVPKAETALEPIETQTILFSAPEGWAPGQKVISRGGITLQHEAAFEVTDGDQQVAITVDRMPGGGSLLENTGRWSMQIGLEPAPQSELEAAMEKIEIGGMQADYIELAGETESVFAAVVSSNKPFWYIKLKGASSLAVSERERFKAFLKSIQFE